MQYPIDMIAHTTASVSLIVQHWLEQTLDGKLLILLLLLLLLLLLTTTTTAPITQQ